MNKEALDADKTADKEDVPDHPARDGEEMQEIKKSLKVEIRNYE